MKQENFDGVADEWVSEFENLQITPLDAIKRIRLAKFEKKYGVTEFTTFMTVNIDEYAEKYKHEHQEFEPEKKYKQLPETAGEVSKDIDWGLGRAEPLRNDLRDFKKNFYDIIEETRDMILLKDDRGITGFYDKEHFRLHQG